MSNDAVYTRKEAAKLCGLSYDTIRRHQAAHASCVLCPDCRRMPTSNSPAFSDLYLRL